MGIENILLGKFITEKINGYLYFDKLSENIYLYKKFLKTEREHTDSFWNTFSDVASLVEDYLCGKKVKTSSDIIIAECLSEEFIKHLIYRKNGTFQVKSTNLITDKTFYLNLE